MPTNSNTQERLPFQGATETAVTKKMKLTNERSSIAKKADEQEAFKQRAVALMDNRQDQRERGVALVTQFLTSMKEKVLPKNQGVLAQELVKLVIEINNDDTEPQDGMGSATLFAALLRVVMLQRDRINELEYRLLQVEKNLSSPPKPET
jgi:hypothetical protein